MKKAKLCAAVMLLTSTIFAGGCKENKLLSEQEYIDYTRGQLTKFMEIVQNENINIDDYRTVKKSVENQKRKLEKIESTLKDVQPPPNYVGEHREMLEVLHFFIRRDDELLEYAKTGSGYDLKQANDYFQVAINNMEDAPTFFTKND